VGAGAGLMRSVPIALIGFAVIGFGVGGLDVAINVEGSRVERAAGRTLMPLMHAAWSAGAVVGAAIGAVATALGVAYPSQFGAEALLIAVIALVGLRGIPSTAAAATHAEGRAPLGQRLRDWLRGWTDARLLLIGLVMLGVELGEGTANNWLTLAVRDGHGFRDSVATWFFVAFAVGETVARVTGGPAVDRLGRVLTVRLTTALGDIGLLLFIFGGAAPLVLVGTLLWALGVSMGFPLGMSAAADSGPGPAARVSVVASIGYVANLGGPPLIGFLSQRFGLLNALFAVVLLLAAGFAFAGALRTKQQPSS
jgi:predicted MFS family arabinose efflux permease